MLGLPPRDPPHTDYISAMPACDPGIVRLLLARVAATTGRPWATAIAGQLHFSEWTLYRVFVDEGIGAPANSFVSDDRLCLAYWDESPLSREGAIDFLRGARPTEVRCGDLSEVSHPTGGPARGLRRASGCTNRGPSVTNAG
jgi:hypothetical protein